MTCRMLAKLAKERVSVMKGRITVFIIVAILIALAGCGKKAEETTEPAPSQPTSPSSPEPINTEGIVPMPESLEWWCRDWYGYWTAETGSDEFGIYEGENKWDCYASFYLDVFGYGILTIWDDGMDIASVVVQIEGFGLGRDMTAGVAHSVDGMIFGNALNQSEWIIDPNRSKFSEQLEIKGKGEDMAGNFIDYYFCLRPWGILWDDIREDDRPPYYDWYLGMREGDMSEVAIHRHS
ncbi:MAG: hypothetical protein LBH28_08875 [Oscillospiraceae bacterium]|nr:hypothetical protein [Oscillospiraceae bacterium]